MSETELILCLLLFLTALIYSSVGHGGASGYLAIMALWGMAPDEMRPAALLLNIFVSLIAFLQFYRKVYFPKKLFFYLSIASVPLSFWGSTISIQSELYKKILGFLLLIPVAKWIFEKKESFQEKRSTGIGFCILLGGSIGFISGLIGIGGGIILSPALLLLRWTNIKETAAVSAVFIFVNSLAGMAGQIQNGFILQFHLIYYSLFAFAGAIIGSYLGSSKFNAGVLKTVLMLVLALAATKLLLTS